MRVAVVTGANSGIGYETALVLAQEGLEVVLACRNEARATKAIEKMLSVQDNLKLNFIKLDLNSKQQIDEFVVSFKKQYDHLDILINNAGVLWGKYQVTDDGFERMFGVNYLGHFYLTQQLLNMIPDSFASRIVTVTSMSYRYGKIKFDDLQSKKSYHRMGTYAQSKLANLLFSMALDKRLKAADKRILSIAVHPGIVMHTNIVPNPIVRFFAKCIIGPFLPNVKRGARPTIEAALSNHIQGGALYGPIGLLEVFGKLGKSKKAATYYNETLALKLWTESEDLMDISFSI